MFEGKIYIYKNVNGKEQKIEKKFNNPEEYNDFISKNPELKKFNDNKIDLVTDFINLWKHLYGSANNKLEDLWILWSDDETNVNLKEYENALKEAQIETNKEEEKNKYEKILEKLEYYLKEFKKINKKELIQKIEEDIKKIKEKLSKYLK